jgi:hypothetical protein
LVLRNSILYRLLDPHPQSQNIKRRPHTRVKEGMYQTINYVGLLIGVVSCLNLNKVVSCMVEFENTEGGRYNYKIIIGATFIMSPYLARQVMSLHQSLTYFLPSLLLFGVASFVVYSHMRRTASGLGKRICILYYSSFEIKEVYCCSFIAS